MREHLFFWVSGGPGFIFTEHWSVRDFFYQISNGLGFPRYVCMYVLLQGHIYSLIEVNV